LLPEKEAAAWLNKVCQPSSLSDCGFHSLWFSHRSRQELGSFPQNFS